jgi:hypothetical protein
VNPPRRHEGMPGALPSGFQAPFRRGWHVNGNGLCDGDPSKCDGTEIRAEQDTGIRGFSSGLGKLRIGAGVELQPVCVLSLNKPDHSSAHP